MISKPQNDLKHTGHVGLDGAYFGDIDFLSMQKAAANSMQQYSHVPRQIVTPYKPSEDIEQTPLLLPPTPTSPDSLQTASGYFPTSAADSTAAAHHSLSAAGGTQAPTSLFSFNQEMPTGFGRSNPFVNQDLAQSLQQHRDPAAECSAAGAFINANVIEDSVGSFVASTKVIRI